MTKLVKRQDGFYREGESTTGLPMKLVIVATMFAAGFIVTFLFSVWIFSMPPKRYGRTSSRQYEERVVRTKEQIYEMATTWAFAGGAAAGGFALYGILAVRSRDRRLRQERLRSGDLPDGIPPPPSNPFDQFGPKE